MPSIIQEPFPNSTAWPGTGNSLSPGPARIRVGAVFSALMQSTISQTSGSMELISDARRRRDSVCVRRDRSCFARQEQPSGGASSQSNDERTDGFALEETPHRNKVVQYRNGSLPDYGGILEPVELLLVPGVRITDVFARPDWKTGKVSLTFSLENTFKSVKKANLQLDVYEGSGSLALIDEIDVPLKPGTNQATHEIRIKNHRLWDIIDPYLYRLQLSVWAEGAEGIHTTSVNCGFRDFRMVNGYFRLNGRRIFLRSTHTGNHCPVRAIAPPDGYPDMLRKDLFYAKSCGYNTIRFDFGTAHPYQLDLCDELGLMVYEESSAGWMLKDSPQMKARYENSMREMVVRDRNHPSVVMWGMLNETGRTGVSRRRECAFPDAETRRNAIDPAFQRPLRRPSGRWVGQQSGNGRLAADLGWRSSWSRPTAMEAPIRPRERRLSSLSKGSADACN